MVYTSKKIQAHYFGSISQFLRFHGRKHIPIQREWPFAIDTHSANFMDYDSSDANSLPVTLYIHSVDLYYLTEPGRDDTKQY